MADINDVADYLIVKMDEGGAPPSIHKLNKLLYYVQGWCLAVHDRPMFDARFQAWVHGPINTDVFDRFTAWDRCLYSIVAREDVREGFAFDALADVDRRLVDDVLESYGMYSGTDLQDMTRAEPAWIKARGKLPRAARCDVELDETLMRDYFRGRREQRA
ncbi:hypothetical protein CDN99_26470 [Roseateles aquatilis]|uniref:Antitoxin SocA-like Panacea domain-containing protein n=1 Tax=Roseateles aquatilis TaxID=431061 RepID=A0A246IT50_9BURK|nr:type II toxin-antitoxin system antitoxin SocA domain-containing protein [Roseateles aquatilis]OWQ83394.1 hypothetical protein CDN99_26470 [Roseateles aquatilis]